MMAGLVLVCYALAVAAFAAATTRVPLRFDPLALGAVWLTLALALSRWA